MSAQRIDVHEPPASIGFRATTRHLDWSDDDKSNAMLGSQEWLTDKIKIEIEINLFPSISRDSNADCKTRTVNKIAV